MAETDFAALPATATIAASDQLLVVRNGAAYRFAGVLPTIEASGNYGFGTPTSALSRVSVAVSQAVTGKTPVVGGQVAGAVCAGLSATVEATSPLGVGVSFEIYKQNVGPTEAGRFDNAGTFRPALDGAQALGHPSFRWNAVYASTGAIQTSDQRAKQQIGAVPDEWLDAWADVEWVRYRFNDAVKAKGDEARWHVGLIAQQVRDAFAAHGLDAMMIGLLCHDEWEATPAIPTVDEVRDEAGEVVTPAQAAIPARPAGDRYGLRYDECQAIEAAYQRRQIRRLTERLDALDAA